jgi:hypothetical protein
VSQDDKEILNSHYPGKTFRSQTTSRVRGTIQDIAALPDNEWIRYEIIDGELFAVRSLTRIGMLYLWDLMGCGRSPKMLKFSYNCALERLQIAFAIHQYISIIHSKRIVIRRLA